MLTNIDRYRRAVDECRVKSRLAMTPEIAQLWITLASSYTFLLDREERLVAEQDSRDRGCLLS